MTKYKIFAVFVLLSMSGCASVPVEDLAALRIVGARGPVQIKHTALCVKRTDGLVVCE